MLSNDFFAKLRVTNDLNNYNTNKTRFRQCIRVFSYYNNNFMRRNIYTYIGNNLVVNTVDLQYPQSISILHFSII